jgi:hypothetical protein
MSRINLFLSVFIFVFGFVGFVIPNFPILFLALSMSIVHTVFCKKLEVKEK